MISFSCQQGSSSVNHNHSTQPLSGDTVYALNTTNPIIRVSMKELGEPRQKKFVRINASQIINPALVPITIRLYYMTAGKEEFLGSVAPFPANNPGSFIIATKGILTREGILELRLNFPQDWDRKDSLELRIETLKLE
jgi:hypothetical protein